MPRQLRMVRPNLENLPALALPVGYDMRTYRKGDEVHWARIISDSFRWQGTYRTGHGKRDYGQRCFYSRRSLLRNTSRGSRWHGVRLAAICR